MLSSTVIECLYLAYWQRWTEFLPEQWNKLAKTAFYTSG